MDQLNELQPVKLYATTLDFLNKQPMMVDAGALINNQSDQHITVKDFFNMETGQKISRAMSAWAVEYKEKNYFNLGYSTEVNNWKSFAKLDLEGKYCLTIIDDKSPKVFKHTNNSYLGGLSGYLATQISLAGTTWVDKTGRKVKVLFIDTQKINQKMMSRNEGSTGDYISRNHFIKILKSEGLNFTDDEVKKMELEQFIQILQSANNKKT